jgi:preprotein translocase subunit SecE
MNQRSLSFCKQSCSVYVNSAGGVRRGSEEMNVQEHSHKMKFSKFLREVKAEVKKVAWPNKKELQSYTGVVFITVIIVALLLYVMDLFSNTVISWIIRS